MRCEESLPDILYHGYPFDGTGYGAACRGYLHAMYASELSFALRNAGTQPSLVLDTVLVEALEKVLTPELYICHMSPAWIARHGITIPPRQTIVITALETEEVPSSWLRSLQGVKEVWLPCQHNIQVFQRFSDIPCFCIPHSIPPECAVACSVDINRRIGVHENDFVFLSIFTWQERKNPLGTIEAFLRAFPGTTGPVLVLKITYGFVEEKRALDEVHGLLSRLGSKSAQGWSRVRIVPEFWTNQMLRLLMRRANCYLALHRGEAWCYPLFEAAISGVPVLSTGYGGPLDYLGGVPESLVRFDFTTVQNPCMDLVPGLTWAEPDLNVAADLMNRVYADWEQWKRRAVTWGNSLQVQYSAAAVGASIKDRVASRSSCDLSDASVSQQVS